MPGSVQVETPTAVLPWVICQAFTQSRIMEVDVNEYPSGDSQRRPKAASSRKAWRLTQRLTRTQWETLRNFYAARKGTVHAFWFYDPWETSPRFNYDSLGIATVGRYAVRFASKLDAAFTMGRSSVPFELLEVPS